MPVDVPASDASIRLVHADDAILVLDKPSGLLSVPGRGPDKQDCLSARVQARYPDALVVHRLDMATSGLLVMARGIAMQRLLNAAFANRSVVKRSAAVVHGQIPDPVCDRRLIDLPIAVDWPNRPRRVVDAVSGKPSVTRWQRSHFDAARQVSHVLLEPLTGRTHQLRVHMHAIGHPILGDTLYAPATVVAMAPRLLLHACELAFAHPVDGRPLQFSRTSLKYVGEPNPER